MARISRSIVWATVPVVVRVVGRVLWRLDIDRQHGLPEPPFVVAANHHSFLDPLLIGAALDQPMRFLGLVDLVGNYRWLDWALRAFDMIPLRRGVVPLGPLRTALRHLDTGGVVALFPEGTRHDLFDPRSALPGAAWLAARSGTPLLPVAISGSEKVLGVDNRLHLGRIRVTVGRPMWSKGPRRAEVDDLTKRWARWVAETLAEKGDGRGVGSM